LRQRIKERVHFDKLNERFPLFLDVVPEPRSKGKRVRRWRSISPFFPPRMGD
jgi:hypothetical protein